MAITGVFTEVPVPLSTDKPASITEMKPTHCCPARGLNTQQLLQTHLYSAIYIRGA